MSSAEKTSFRAVVVKRASRGGGNYVWPMRVYLLLCRVDENGKAIVPRRATSAPDWAYVRENKRATRRLYSLLGRAEALAAQVNAGEMSFGAARGAFLQ